MAKFRAGTEEESAFLQELLAAGMLIDSGIPGLVGRGEGFERIRAGVDALITRAAAADQPERMAFPPLLPKRQLEQIGYLKSFPHLAGSVFSFYGDEEEAAEQERKASMHEDWSEHQSQTDLVLTPAACYPVYPAIAARGPLPGEGATIDAGGSYVFRHEPSGDPARLQMFHQREMVRIGTPEIVLDWREQWRDRAVQTLRGIGLDATFDVANDPFFGRSGRLLARSQRSQELKFEVHVQIASPQPTAVASFNYHQDHFAQAYGLEIAAADGQSTTAHTACLGFGLERITLALLRTHGLLLEQWPGEIRGALELE